MAFYGGPRGPPPPPWQVVVAPGQPRPYYYNPVTNVTTWEPPPLPPPPPMSAPVPDAAPGGIPRPDPILEPERYEAWLQVTQHIQSGDKNTASFSGLQNAAGNGIKGHITDAGGLKLGDCHLLCGNQNLRRVRADSSRRPPRHRRAACSMAWRCWFLTTRRGQHGRVIAEK